ncbi:MFS transporter [soil metagenome]|jgi:predicted MFS family arabinose efflux permease|nr:MFS transporter [Deinococcota bacterium]
MPKPAAVFSLFAVAYFLSYFYRAANAVIAPDLVRDLALTAAQLGLMTSLFYAAFAAVQLPLGSLLDRYGPRLVTPALMLVGALGSLLFALAEGFALLALGRALIGVGMAGILMGALKAFSYWFPPLRFATVSGLFMSFGASGALIAATPLAWLSAEFGWRAAFFWGSLAVVASAAAIGLWSRNNPPDLPWQSGAGGGSLGDVFRHPTFWRIAPLAAFLAGTQLAVHTLWGGPYLSHVWGMSPIETGNLLLLMALGVMLGFLLSGWLADRFGLTRVVILAMTLFLLTQASFALPGLIPSPALLGPLYALFGLSGASNVLLLAHTRAIFPATITGRAVTATNLFGIGGSALLQWFMGVLIGLFAPDALGHYPPLAYTAAFGFTATGGLAALLWYLPVQRAGKPARDQASKLP